MKKFIIFLVTATCAIFYGSAFVAKPAMEVEGTFGAYLSGSSEEESYTYQASYLIDGSDVTYTIYNWHFDIEHKFTLVDVVSEDSHPTNLQNISVYDQSIIVSSGIFTGEWYEDTDEPIYCVIFYDSKDNKYLVYNDRGEIVGELPLNANGQKGYFMMSVVSEGPTYYVTVDEDETDKNSGYTFWSFEEGVGVEEIRSAQTGLSVYPNPLHEQQTLTIKLPYLADNNTVLTIFDMSGLQSINKKVEVGQSQIEISGGLLSPGMNVYTLEYSNGETFSGKLIKE